MQPQTELQPWHSSRRIQPWPHMTFRMFQVLHHLRDAQNADSPFVALSGVHKNTIRALVESDMVFESPGLDGDRYKITGRGLKALKVYE